MDLNTLLLYLIVALVMIGLPVLLAKKTGKNPMELLFGDRVNGTIFGKKKKDQKDGSEQEKKQVSKGKKRPAVQRNSSKQEFMTSISELLTYARRHRFYSIMPGTLMHGEDVATLAVVIVTRNSVLGFNFFGYGGTLYAGSGEDPWRQVLEGEEKQIDSPAAKNRKQKEILDAVLKECGYPAVPTEIFGVFTASGTILKDHKNTHCCTQKAMMELLKANRFFENGGVNPQEVGKALASHVKKKD